MSKEELRWRLAERPTVDNITKLLEQKVITNEEARELLFSKDNPSDKIKALEEQVEYLTDIVNRAKITPDFVRGYSPPRMNWTLTNFPTIESFFKF